MVGITILINIFAFKNHMTYKLYQSRYLEDKWSKKIKLWVYDVLSALCLGKVLRKCGYFRQEHLLLRSHREIDQKLSLENILRVKKYLKRAEARGSHIISQDKEDNFDY